MIGIYKITNNKNGKFYIGCSKDIKERWNNHRSCHLNKNDKCYNTRFYRALRKYGVENFTFDILEECSLEDMLEREIYYISKFNSTDDSIGYNISRGGDASGLNNEGENHPKAKLTEKDVIDIRNLYAEKNRDIFDVYEDYKDCIQWRGFQKVWSGYTWTKVNMDVYTKENKEYHKRKAQSRKGEKNRSSILSEQDVINIRTRKKNGEDSITVFDDYKHLMKRSSFLHVWNEKNWKHIKI